MVFDAHAAGTRKGHFLREYNDCPSVLQPQFVSGYYSSISKPNQRSELGLIVLYEEAPVAEQEGAVLSADTYVVGPYLRLVVSPNLNDSVVFESADEGNSFFLAISHFTAFEHQMRLSWHFEFIQVEGTTIVEILLLIGLLTHLAFGLAPFIAEAFGGYFLLHFLEYPHLQAAQMGILQRTRALAWVQ